MDSFSYWLQVLVTHEYYTNIPLVWIPNDETKHFMEKARITLRALEGGIGLIRQHDEWADQRWQLFTGDDIDQLRFHLCPLDDEFYYVSEWDDLTDIGSGVSLIDSVLPQVWKILTIPFDTLKTILFNTIQVSIKTKARYWEYILIPKYNSIDLQLNLQEKKNKIQFGAMETMTFLGKQALRVLTAEAVALNELKKCSMQLNEVRSSGERLLSNHVPNPKPFECSPNSPKDTITTYYYF